MIVFGENLFLNELILKLCLDATSLLIKETFQIFSRMKYNLVIYLLILLSAMSCHKQTKSNAEIDNSTPVSETDDFVSVINEVEYFNSYVNDSLKSLIMKLEKSFKGNYPSYYAGYSIDESNNNLIILIVGNELLKYKKYEDEFATRLESNNFSIATGKYAYKELLRVKKIISDYVDTHKNNGVAQNIEHFDVYGNKVVVYLKDDSYSKTSEFRKDITDSPVIGLTKINRYPGGIGIAE